MKRKLTALIMGVVLMLSGCAGTQDKLPAGNGTDGTAAQSGKEGENGEAGNENEPAAMGRYVETSTELYETIGSPLCLGRLSNGDVVAVGENMVKAVSHDSGATWEQEPIAGLPENFVGENYVMSAAVSPDGTIVLQYFPNGGLDDNGDLDLFYLSVSPDGTQRGFTIDAAAEEYYPDGFFFDDTGKCYAPMLGTSGSIYEINVEDGSSTRALRTEGSRAEIIQFIGSRMLLCSYDGIRIYDRDTQTYIEDTVINDFIKEQYENLEGDNGNGYHQYVFTDGEAMYIAGKKGLHRHAMSGMAVEQVIDGTLSSFGDPSYGIVGAVALANQEFVALFSNGRAVRFVYDPNVPTVPGEKIVVYSLQQNDTVQQAVSLYQSTNSGLYIEYQVGMGEKNTVTREDALKKLNTQLMAGEGPDVLILDNMPVDSYMEKKILLDIRDVVNEAAEGEGLFTNLLEPFYQGDALYMAPCEIQLPIMIGEKDKVTQMSDLEKTADAIEQIRQENPDKEIFRIYSPKGIMKKFATVSAPAWKQTGGAPDMAKIEEFLLQTKRIYDAQMENASQEWIQWYAELNERYLAEYGTSYEDNKWFNMGSNSIIFLEGRMQLDLATMYYPYGCADNLSLPKAPGFENYAVVWAAGQCSQVYIPGTLAGINASSANTEEAKEFLRFMLSSEVQTMLHNGLPVNVAAYEKEFTPNPEILGENNSYGGVASSNGDGVMVEMDIYWPTDAELEAIREQMSTAKTPYLCDTVLEEAVYTAGAEYFLGYRSLEEAMAAIEEKVAIYAAE